MSGANGETEDQASSLRPPVHSLFTSVHEQGATHREVGRVRSEGKREGKAEIRLLEIRLIVLILQ